MKTRSNRKGLNMWCNFKFEEIKDTQSKAPASAGAFSCLVAFRRFFGHAYLTCVVASIDFLVQVECYIQMYIAVCVTNGVTLLLPRSRLAATKLVNQI
ncbi:hypothetical protein JL49_21735 [Pseudoalteromonas luteoviolacea]|nr:hypothetical protein JL49_21735 [Pseudoalteromonas luteoviolacea]